MKTVTLTAWNRPELTQAALEALSRNNAEGYTLLIGIDPGCSAVFRLCASVRFMPKRVIHNPVRLGINYNCRRIYELAFKSGSEFNVALEDDILLSPDALDMANWFHDLNQQERYACLSLFNHSKGGEDAGIVRETDAFCPWGWCFGPKTWHLIRGRWMCDSRGWDYAIQRALGEAQSLNLMPDLARSRHVGTHGVHYRADSHAQHFDGHVASDGAVRGYRIQK